MISRIFWHLFFQVFLRELISNASDALDKIRLLSLTDKSVLSSTDELSIKIKADKENHSISVTDTGIGKYITKFMGKILIYLFLMENFQNANCSAVIIAIFF